MSEERMIRFDTIRFGLAHVVSACAVIGTSLLLMSSASLAQTPAEFYRGKQIALLVGFGTGGEDDLWARMISRHLPTHIPGNPNVVPQHIPGSGGLLVVNRLYNTAARDGAVIGMINRGIPFEPLLGGQGTQFDALKINYIGSPGRDTTVCAARKDAAVQSLQDLYTKELPVGGTGSGADTAIYPEFLSALLGLKFKLVKGYQGSYEVQLAMERGEVQGMCVAYDSLSRSNLARAGAVNLLLQAAITPRSTHIWSPDGVGRRPLGGRPQGARAVLRAARHGTPARGAARFAAGSPGSAPPGLRRHASRSSFPG